MGEVYTRQSVKGTPDRETQVNYTSTSNAFEKHMSESYVLKLPSMKCMSSDSISKRHVKIIHSKMCALYETYIHIQ